MANMGDSVTNEAISDMAEDLSKEYAELLPVQMDFVSIGHAILCVVFVAHLMPRLKFQVELLR